MSETYSFSKLKSFEQCRYQYFLTYVLDPERTEEENNAFAEYGGFVHKLLERYGKGELEVFELANEYETHFFEEVLSPFPNSYGKYLGDGYYADGYKFLSEFEGYEDMDVVGIEQEVLMQINDLPTPYMFKGYIDLLYKDKDNNLIIRDWKSKSKFASKREQAEYAKQLYTYARYVKETYGVFPTAMEFYLFRTQTSIIIPFVMDDYDKTWEWVNTTISTIRETTDYPLTINRYYCENLCGYRTVCNQQTEDENGI
ncbi:MAG TPA: PD-(D/E)XK nuclease family protein [Saprospiraceae bacterium]|nr:PD-(D/E)XK nuclease family protein [Saprospiraceae bacterium]